MLHDNTQALARYNSHFNNQQYQAIADQLAIDLRSERDSMRVSDVLNCITDTALSLFQHSHYADAWIKLASLCRQNGVSIVAIDMIYIYLLIYQQSSENRQPGYQMTAKCLLKAYESADTLRATISCANAVHGWRGRMPYQLFAAAEYLVQAAVHLLIDDNLSYIHEKLHHGLQRLTVALHEAVRYSPRPDRLDFSVTMFPSHSDRG